MCYTHSSGDRSTLSCFCQFFPLHYCYCCVYIARDIIYSIECLARLICADHNRIAFATWIQIKREFVFLFCFCCFKKKNRKRNHKNIPSLHKIAVLLLLFAISTRTLLSIWKRKKMFFFSIESICRFNVYFYVNAICEFYSKNDNNNNKPMNIQKHCLCCVKFVSSDWKTIYCFCTSYYMLSIS